MAKIFQGEKSADPDKQRQNTTPFLYGCFLDISTGPFSSNNRFCGSLDCDLSARQVEAYYAKSAQRVKKEGKDRPDSVEDTKIPPLFLPFAPPSTSFLYSF